MSGPYHVTLFVATSMNTSASPACWNTHQPFYYTEQPSLLEGISDYYLTLAAPILAYWSLSLFFHILDISEWKWLDQYRIHDSSEVRSRNRATRTEVLCAVLFQHIIQTLLGLVWMSAEEQDGQPADEMQRLLGLIRSLIGRFEGGSVDEYVLSNIVYMVYWWGIPSVQFLAAMWVFSHQSHK